MQWSETKRTILFSRTKFEGQDRQRVRKILTGREESSSDNRSKIPCRYKNCKKNGHVDFGIFPCVKTTSICGRKCLFRHVEAEKPSKNSKKGGTKGSVALLKESTQVGCVSQDSHPRNSVLREKGKLGSKHAVNFSKGTWHQIKIRERKGPSRGIIPKCEPHERSPCAPKFEERSHEETVHQERCARRVAWDLAKNIHKLKNADKATFL